MKYAEVEKLIKVLIKHEARKNKTHFTVVLDKNDDRFRTSKDTGVISIGVSDVYNKEDIMFTDMVSYLINSVHECNHALQFRAIRKSKVIDDYVETFSSEYDNQTYYLSMYYHSPLELDAQYNALRDTRAFLHHKYPGHNAAIDKHVLYWGIKWFDSFLDNNGNLLEIFQCDNLDSFLDKFDCYRSNHYERNDMFHYDFNKCYSDNIWNIINQHKATGRIHPYDICFENADSIKLQRDAAFLINVMHNDKLKFMIPVLNDTEQLSFIESRVINYEFQSDNVVRDECDYEKF